MKRLYLLGGTMGVGKTTVSQQLKQDLPNSVFLDGDWCWDADPFQVTEETKSMVIRNICYLLNSFLHCTAYENIVKIIDFVIHHCILNHLLHGHLLAQQILELDFVLMDFYLMLQAQAYFLQMSIFTI